MKEKEEEKKNSSLMVKDNAPEIDEDLYDVFLQGVHMVLYHLNMYATLQRTGTFTSKI